MAPKGNKNASKEVTLDDYYGARCTTTDKRMHEGLQRALNKSRAGDSDCIRRPLVECGKCGEMLDLSHHQPTIEQGGLFWQVKDFHLYGDSTPRSVENSIICQHCQTINEVGKIPVDFSEQKKKGENE